MCDVMLAGLAVTAISTGLSAFAAYQQAGAQNKANEYNASIQRRNADVANLQAKHAIEVGQVEENIQRQKVKQLIGTQRAQIAGAGLLVDADTGLELTKETAGFGELDALSIRSNAARQAWGAQQQAAGYSAQASLATMGKTSPFLAAAPSLLSGASQLARGIYQYNKLT